MRHWWLLLLLSLFGAMPCAAEKHALLIGIDDYQNNIRPLTAAAADVQSMAAALKEVGQFKPQNVRVLSSQSTLKPTRANILSELSRLAKSARAGDIIFILYSGHGLEMNGQSYLVPSDANPTNAKTLQASCIMAASFNRKLKTLPAAGVVLTFDMCRNSPFGDNSRSLASARLGSGPLSRGLSKDLVLVPTSSGPRAAITLFSCRAGERSWEWQERKRGYFSYFLEQGLRQGAAGPDGKVRMGALMAYLEENVPLAVQVTEKQNQTPWSELRGSGGASLVLATVQPAAADSTSSSDTSPPNALPADSSLAKLFRQETEILSDAFKNYASGPIRRMPKMPLPPHMVSREVRVASCDSSGLVLLRTQMFQDGMRSWQRAEEYSIPLQSVVLKAMKMEKIAKTLPYHRLIISMPNGQRLIRRRISRDQTFSSTSILKRDRVDNGGCIVNSRLGAQTILKSISKLVILRRMMGNKAA